MSKYLITNFLSDASDEDEQLADALLSNPHCIEIVGAVLRETREANYEKQGFVFSDDYECIGELVGKPGEIPKPPGDDHGTLFRRKSDGKPCFYLSMPYGLCRGDIKLIHEYCERYGLEAYFDAHDTWFPGRTIGIMYSVAVDGPNPLTPRYKV